DGALHHGVAVGEEATLRTPGVVTGRGGRRGAAYGPTRWPCIVTRRSDRGLPKGFTIRPFSRGSGDCPARWRAGVGRQVDVRRESGAPPRLVPRERGAGVRRTSYRSVKKRGLRRGGDGRSSLDRGCARASTTVA